MFEHPWATRLTRRSLFAASIWQSPYSRALAIVLALSMALLPPATWAQSAPRAPGQRIGSEGKELVAVLDVEAVGASKVEATAISERLREELLRTGKFTLVDRAQMNSVLEEQALQQSGCTSQECAVQVGKVLGVKKLISGKVIKVSETQWLLSANMVDVETAEQLRAESIRHRGDYFSLLDEAVADVAKRLGGAAAPPSAVAQVAPRAAVQQAQQAGAPGQAPPPEEKKGSSTWLWWTLGILAVVGIAAAAGGGGGSKSSPTSTTTTTTPTCSGCGSVHVTW